MMFGTEVCFAESEDNKTSEKIDAVLALDTSGSMLLTDPLKLREQGAKLFTSFLKADDRLAIVGFDRAARVVRPLLEYLPAETGSIAAAIDGLGSSGEFTDLYEGVRTAFELLQKSPREGARQVIILLSDGKMEPDPASAFPANRTAQLMNQLLPELRAKEVKVYTLAFSDLADQELLSEMTAATDGMNWFTKSVDQIHSNFADLFLVVKKPQVAPLTSKGFRVDETVTEATFYIARDEGMSLILIDPNGNEFSADSVNDSIKWFSASRFDVITVIEPITGDWQVRGANPSEGFATLLTDLKLITEWPAMIRADEPVVIEARLFEREKPISLPGMAKESKFGFQVTPTDRVSEPIIRDFLSDDGKNGDRIEGDGIFSRAISIVGPGEYKLSVVAKAPTFQRTQQLPFRVKPRLVALQVSSRHGEHSQSKEHHDDGTHEGEHGTDAEKGDHHGEVTPHSEEGGEKHDTEATVPEGSFQVIKGSDQSEFLVELSAETSAFRNTVVELFATDSKRRKFKLPLKKSQHSSSEYTCSASTLPSDGYFKLLAVLKAETKKKEHVNAESKPLNFERASQGPVEQGEAVMIVEEKVEPAPPGEPFPFIYLLIVTAVNGGLAFIGKTATKKLMTGGQDEVPEYAVPTELSGALVELQQLVNASEVNLDDPRFKDIEDEIFQDDGSTTAPTPPTPEPEEVPAEGGE